MRAPIAARLLFTPTSLRLIQSLPLPGFSKQPEGVSIAQNGATGHGKDVFAAVAGEIGERHAVALMQLAGA